MPLKKDNEYEHAEIIIDILLKKSGMSQGTFADEILGINRVNIHRARNSGKIPDHWFVAFEKKLGIKKEDLIKQAAEEAKKARDGNYKPCTLRTAAVNAFTMPYGNASDDLEMEHCLREFRSLFQVIIRWQEDENGLDSLTSMNFVREFHERFPELGEWLKKRKGKNIPDRELQDSIADGTDG